MLIVFSHPEKVLNEDRKMNSILEHHPSVLLHLRKPDWKEPELNELLLAIDPVHHERIVLHQHHQLCTQWKLKGAHLTENRRKETPFSEGIISTSFHSINEARSCDPRYSYFFCSPVFPSISKIGYSCDEDWNIGDESEGLRTKAVALGGIEPSRKKELDMLGFRNYAVLGAVWYAADPVDAFRRLAEVFGE